MSLFQDSVYVIMEVYKIGRELLSMIDIKRGNVYVVDLNEINPDFCGFYPVLILQNDKGNKYCDTTFGVPIDVSERRGRAYIPIKEKGLHTGSKILCNNVMSFERKRVKSFLFTLDEKRLKRVDELLIRNLGLDSLPR